jgi:SAM-dependent methyltransferase
MNSSSFRRNYLDDCLVKYQYLLKGKVLDVGGKKTNRRGKFIPPLHKVKSWEYLNNDKNTEPDYYCDAENIPLEDQSIDTVIITEVLEYIPYPDKVISEVYRVLRKNGHLLISTPLLNPVHGDYWVDRMRYTAVSLKEMSELAGFEVQSIESMGSVGAVIYDILRVAGGYASKRNRRSITGVLLPFFRPLFYLMEKLYPSQKDFINTGYFLIAIKRQK